jgi:HrpA-like RNA helicase
MYSRTEEAMRALEATENERKDCIDELIQSIPDNGGVVPTLRKKSSEEVGIIDDEPETVSWDDDSADSGISSALTDTKPSKASFQLKAQFMSRVTTTAYRGMLKERSALPIFSFRDELLRTIRVNPVTVVCAETGAGKVRCLVSSLESNIVCDALTYDDFQFTQLRSSFLDNAMSSVHTGRGAFGSPR